ncbi:MAG: hypothetical protein U1E58_14770 [Tabrizicola sp.]
MDDQRAYQIICEGLRQTELQLEDLQSIATSSEARAFQFAGYCVLIATFASPFAEKLPNPLAFYLCAAGLMFSAVWAIYSVIPRRFHIRGHRWEDWKDHIPDNDSLVAVLISQADENDARIKFNYEVLEQSAMHFRVSFCFALVSVSIFSIGQLF